MQTAIRINALMKENSADSQLVIITLPKAPRGEEGKHLVEYLFVLQLTLDIYHLNIIYYFQPLTTFSITWKKCQTVSNGCCSFVAQAMKSSPKVPNHFQQQPYLFPLALVS